MKRVMRCKMHVVAMQDIKIYWVDRINEHFAGWQECGQKSWSDVRAFFQDLKRSGAFTTEEQQQAIDFFNAYAKRMHIEVTEELQPDRPMPAIEHIRVDVKLEVRE